MAAIAARRPQGQGPHVDASQGIDHKRLFNYVPFWHMCGTAGSGCPGHSPGQLGEVGDNDVGLVRRLAEGAAAAVDEGGAHAP